jgi:hypothetical protein
VSEDDLRFWKRCKEIERSEGRRGFLVSLNVAFSKEKLTGVDTMPISMAELSERWEHRCPKRRPYVRLCLVREVSRPKRIYATGGKILEEPAVEGQKRGRCLLKYCPCTGRNALRDVTVNEDFKTALALGYRACDVATGT